MKPPKGFKSLFKRQQKALREFNKLTLELDRVIEETWGFSHSATDDSDLIDTVDYGTVNIDADEFIDMMNYYHQSFSRGEDFPIPYSKKSK